MRILAIASILVALTAGCIGPASLAVSSEPGPDACLFQARPYILQTYGPGVLMRDSGWENPCQYAHGVLQVSSSAFVQVRVLDADGNTVLELEASSAGTSQEIKTSSPGAPGQWTVEVTGVHSATVQVLLSPQWTIT